MANIQTLGEMQQPRRLIKLKEACSRRGISVRTYYRDCSVLPMPVMARGRLFFSEQEVDDMIGVMLNARNGQS